MTSVGVNNVVLGTGITDTNWHHVAVTKTNGVVVFYVDGVAYSAPAYNPSFVFTTGLTIGAGDGFNYSFYGSIDELAVYNRALPAIEVRAIYNASSSGKCVGPAGPLIVIQPTNQTIFVSEGTTFYALALGDPPLAYQWAFNGTNIAAATNVALTVTNAQASDAGNYTVIVTNLYGSTTTAVAILTVNAPPPCAPAPSGILGWWPGDGLTTDVVGGNGGTLAGNAAFGPGKVGQAFVFEAAGMG